MVHQLDSYRKIPIAQKKGKAGYGGQKALLRQAITCKLPLPRFCTSFVDKIVRKHFDSPGKP
jgi:hypothetical protein